jgi:diaminopimelate decarboxylase
VISGELATALAEEFGTPLYVYDLGNIDERCSELRALLPHDAKLFYSMKANPLPAVAATARVAGCGVEISSEGELAAAIEAGCEPASMVYTGPAKSERELRRAVNQGVGCFSAESLRDLERIAAAARRASTTARVIIRLNPTAAPRARLAMTGVPSHFGCEEMELERLGERILAVGGVDVAGIHVYLGTQLADASALAEAFRIAFDAAERTATIFRPRVVDLGGGFPWPFASTEAAPNLEPLAASLRALVESHVASLDAELWFESGRYIAASSGTMLARVMDVKHSRGTTFYLLDAGVSHLGGMSGLGRVLRPAASLVAIERGSSSESIRADVVGPLCTPLDCLARAINVPKVEPGELVAIPNVGAYGATASLSGFLSRPTALEVSLRGEQVVSVARLRSGHEPLQRATGVN